MNEWQLWYGRDGECSASTLLLSIALGVDKSLCLCVLWQRVEVATLVHFASILFPFCGNAFWAQHGRLNHKTVWLVKWVESTDLPIGCQSPHNDAGLLRIGLGNSRKYSLVHLLCIALNQGNHINCSWWIRKITRRQLCHDIATFLSIVIFYSTLYRDPQRFIPYRITIITSDYSVRRGINSVRT